MMEPLYHITSAEQAHAARQSGTYRPAGFAAEGFMHCSYRHQVSGVANRLFGGRADLVVLEIDRRRLSCKVVDENLEGGDELFPHVYGPLPMSAVTSILPLPCGEGGRFEFPAGARVQQSS